MNTDRENQIRQLECIMETPENYLPQGQKPTKENLRVVAREALFLKLDLEQMS